MTNLLNSMVLGLTLTFTMAAATAAETYVLVHGAFQSAASWSQVKAGLEAAGHTVIAVELPGRDTTGAAAKAVTLNNHVAAVRAAVESVKVPVVLVAHSFGGITASRVAEEVPDKVASVIYVAAYVPVSGESMQKLAEGDRNNGFTQASFVVAKDYASATILESDRIRLFAAEGTPDQHKTLLGGFLSEPLGPIATPVTLGSGFASVKKAYVKTSNDAIVSPALQTMMVTRGGITKVAQVDSGHAPYLTAAPKLVAVLRELVK
jgi:pimeloyl-ACP methyl ester carboxylesterase